jgi:hypothetical protein
VYDSGVPFILGFTARIGYVKGDGSHERDEVCHLWAIGTDLQEVALGVEKPCRDATLAYIVPCLTGFTVRMPNDVVRMQYLHAIYRVQSEFYAKRGDGPCQGVMDSYIHRLIPMDEPGDWHSTLRDQDSPNTYGLVPTRMPSAQRKGKLFKFTAQMLLHIAQVSADGFTHLTTSFYPAIGQPNRSVT